MSSKDSGSSAGDNSVLSRDWTVTAHEVYYCTGDGKLLLEDVTMVIPGSSACALVGSNVADKGSLLRLLSGAARGGYFSGRIAYGGQPYHDAHLLSTFVESPHSSDFESSFFGGGGGVVELLTPSESVEYATYLRFGYSRDRGDRWQGIVRTLGLDDEAALKLSPRAAAVLTRIACAVVRSPPIVCVEDPFRGLEPAACGAVADAMAALTARGFTIVASLDSVGLPESVFDKAFSRVVALRDGKVLYCGETRHAAAHCAAVAAGRKPGKRGGDRGALRLDAVAKVAANPLLATACRDAYVRSAVARRNEQEASHVEAIDEERSSVHWLSPPYVPQSTKFRILASRSLRRAARASPVLGLPLLSERHLGAIGVALVWGAAFWDAARLGRDSLAYYDLTSVAFATGQIVVAATLAAAPELCRRHAEFERERRARDCLGLEHVVARTLMNALDAAALALAPLSLYVAAGMPVGSSVLSYVYALSAILAFSCSCAVEALAAWTHSPPPADAYGGGGGDFETERALSRRAERVTRGAFGAMLSCMVLSTGFGIELRNLVRANPFYWHARVNHLRWHVQGVVLRTHGAPHYHTDANLTGTGWPRFKPADSISALLVLAALARLVTAYFLSIDPPKLRHVEAKKLMAWATRPPTPPQVAVPVGGAVPAPGSVGGPGGGGGGGGTGPADDEKKEAGVAEKKVVDGVEVAPPPSVEEALLHQTKELEEKEKERGQQQDAEAGEALSPSRAAFKAAIESYPVTLAAHGVSLAWKRKNRITPVVCDASLSVSAKESVLISGDDKDAARCLLRALAGRDCRRGDKERVGASGRVAVNGGKRSDDWRRKCAWLAAHDARLDAVAALKPREAVAFALMLVHSRTAAPPPPKTSTTHPGLHGYVARNEDGELSPPPDAAWWIEVALDVADVPRAARDGVLGELGSLARRRVALACELVLAPVVVFCDDLGGGARAPSAGSREALAPRDAAALTATCAALARSGCAVVATAHSPTRAAVMLFDRVALLVSRRRPHPASPSSAAATPLALSTGFSYLAADEAPALVLGMLETKKDEPHGTQRDLELRPLDVAISELERRDAGETSGPTFQLALLDFEGADPMGAGALVRPPGAGVLGALRETATQLRRELAALVADRNVLGAALGAPLANVLLLAAAFWNQGHDDARTVVWLAYCLLATFVTPAAVTLPRQAAVARTFGVEADAGVVSPLPFAISQLLGPIPLIAIRALLVVPATYAAAGFLLDLPSLGVACAACAVAGVSANAIALAAVWLYTAKAAPNAFALDAPATQRRRAMVSSRANDLVALVALVALVFAGAFRFVADFDKPWRAVADADFVRWLLHAIALPQLRGKSAPAIFDTHKSAVDFVGYADVNAPTALAKASLYGPLPLVLIALLVLARMRTIDRE
ncbi:hypothetical protein CTAYLR_007822 [Chrysophaeum taylorii]|uniref:ABC-2 type transporter transmembrane domain-containing protein n=1 Tax=Chrysophaeum taylorii TaxID=2483200 RepID=A0AAD7UA37_9STRA|nr:hypothetical protein CTAYLR_007822 [Chrysophaeum taylorii]